MHAGQLGTLFFWSAKSVKHDEELQLCAASGLCNHVAQLGFMIQLKDTVQNKYLGTRMHHYLGCRDAQAAGALEVDRETKPCKLARQEA